MCRRQDVSVRTVILLKLDYLCIRKVLLKVQNILNISTSPLINALIIVAHHTKVAACACEKPDNFILQPVRILIFVNHDISEG